MLDILLNILGVLMGLGLLLYIGQRFWNLHLAINRYLAWRDGELKRVKPQ